MGNGTIRINGIEVAQCASDMQSHIVGITAASDALYCLRTSALTLSGFGVGLAAISIIDRSTSNIDEIRSKVTRLTKSVEQSAMKYVAADDTCARLFDPSYTNPERVDKNPLHIFEGMLDYGATVVTGFANWVGSGISAIGNWVEENRTTIMNVGKVVFGVAGIVTAVGVMFIPGVNVVAGAFALSGAVFAANDILSGGLGLLTGADVDLLESTTGNVAEALGVDRSWGEGVYHVLSIVSAVGCIATAPSQVAKLATQAESIGTTTVRTTAEVTTTIGSGTGAINFYDRLKKGFEAVNDIWDYGNVLLDSWDAGTSFRKAYNASSSHNAGGTFSPSFVQ